MADSQITRRPECPRNDEQVSLFITCFNDTLFPGTGKAVVRPARAARARGRLPDGPDLLRADALQHRLPARGDPAGAALRRGLQRRRGGRLAVGLVRRDGPRDLPQARPSSPTTRSWRGPSRRADPAGLRALRVPRQQAGRRGRRRLLPAPGDVPPDLPLAADAPVGDAPLRLLRGSGGSTWWSCRAPRSAAGSAARSRSRTPTRRWPCSATRSAACSTPAPSTAPRPTTRA